MLPRFESQQRRLSRKERLSLLALTTFLGLVVVALFTVSLSDLGHSKAYFDSKRQNYLDNNSDEDHCHLRKEPIVLVKAQNAVLIVFESTCGLVYHVPTWTISEFEGEVRKVGDVLPERRKIDLAHYAYHKRLQNLVPGVDYVFKVTVADLDASKEYKFRLPSALGNASLRLGLISDTHWGVTAFRRQLERMRDRGIDLLIHVGDIIQHSDDLAEWQLDFFDPIRLLQRFDPKDGFTRLTPIVSVAGNHDTRYASSYGVVIGHSTLTLHQAHFVFMSYVDTVEQREWFAQETKSSTWREATFRIVVTHVPPYIEYWEPEAWERGDKKWGESLREVYLPEARARALDMVVSGHSHLYQRGARKGVHYFVIGGGGGDLESSRVMDFGGLYSKSELTHHFALMELRGCELKWEARTDLGHDLDEVEITSKTCHKPLGY